MYVCVCVCGSLIVVLECVCVCVWKKCLVVISLQRICRIPCRKEESVSVRFLTGNRKKKLCVQKVLFNCLGHRDKNRTREWLLKRLYLHWAPTSDWCCPKEKRAVSLRCEPNGRTIETVLLDHGQAPFVWKVTEPAYSQGRVWCTPFRIRFLLWLARPPHSNPLWGPDCHF